MDTLIHRYGIPSRPFILIEAALFERAAERGGHEFAARMRKLIKLRTHAWKSVDAGMAYNVRIPPWRSWHPDVLECTRVGHFPQLPSLSSQLGSSLQVSAFRPIPNPSTPGSEEDTEAWVTLKTSAQQHLATFNDVDGCLHAAEILETLLPHLQVHMTFGERHDNWYVQMIEH